MRSDCRGASVCQNTTTIGLKGATQPRDYSWDGKSALTYCTCRQTLQVQQNSEAKVNGIDVSKGLTPGQIRFLQCKSTIFSAVNLMEHIRLFCLILSLKQDHFGKLTDNKVSPSVRT